MILETKYTDKQTRIITDILTNEQTNEQTYYSTLDKTNISDYSYIAPGKQI